MRMGNTAAVVAWIVLAGAVFGQAEKPLLVLEQGGHSGFVRCVKFTPDDAQLITSGADGTIRFWDVKSGQLARTLRLPAYGGLGARVFAVSPKGNLLVFPQEKTPKVYSIAFMRLPEDGTVRFAIDESPMIQSMAISPDGKMLATGNRDDTASLWDIATGRRLHVMRGHRARVDDIAFSPDGRRVATASGDGTARIWFTGNGAEEAVLDDRSNPMCGIAWSPDGKRLVTGSLAPSLRLWRADGTLVQRFPHIMTSRSPVFTKDGDGVLVADIQGGRLFDLVKGVDRARFPIEGEFAWSAAMTSDQRIAATSGQFGEDLYLWSTDTGKVLHRLSGPARSPRGAAWSPDGKSVGWGVRPVEIFDWDKPGHLALRHPLERSFDLTELEWGGIPGDDWKRAITTSGPLSVAIHPWSNRASGWLNIVENGRIVSTIAQDWSSVYTFVSGDRILVGGGSALKLYDARSGEVLRSYTGGRAHHALSLSPDHRFAVSPGNSQILTIRKLDRSEPFLSLFFSGDNWIAWTPEGYYAASPGGERLMGWQVNNAPDQLATFYPAAQFRKSLYRPDVIKLLLKAGSIEKALEMADATRGKNSARADVAEVLPPKVTITSPAKSLALRETNIEVRARATSVGMHPVTSLQLLVDGRPQLNGLFRVDNPKLGDVATSWTVHLKPGIQRVTVRAESAVSSGLSDEIEITHVAPDPAEKPRLPSLYVLAIGISDYPGSLKLNYAAKDARALAQTLQQVSKPLFEKIEVKELLDKQATRTEILKAITLLKKQATQRDCAIVFFAGHGDMSSDGGLFLLPADIDPDDLEATGIASEQIRNLLTAFPSKVIFMLDACHSGGIDNVRKKRNDKPLTDDLIRDLVIDERGVIALCASTGRQFALESNEHRHGLFTLAIIEALQGKATKTADGAVYLHHLDAYVTDRVKELSQGRQSPTTARPASIRSFPLSRP